MKRAVKRFTFAALTLILGAALLTCWALWSRKNATWELRHEAAGLKVWERFDAVAVEFTRDWEFTVSDGRPEEPVTWFMNTNFMDSLHQTMGLAVVDGKTLSKRTTGGGIFMSRAGNQGLHEAALQACSSRPKPSCIGESRMGAYSSRKILQHGSGGLGT